MNGDDEPLWPLDTEPAVWDLAIASVGDTGAEPIPFPVSPQPGPQVAFLESPADIVFFGGQAFGGKTFGLLLDALRDAHVPGFGAVIFRRTAPQITQQDGLWDKSMDLYIGAGATPRETFHDWTFPSGAVVRFSHLQHEKDRFAWKGAGITLLGYDQAEEFTKRQFWYLLSRNRSMCGAKPRVRATCNPVPPDDPVGGWIHELIGWWIGPDGLAIEERSGVLRWFIRVNDELVWFDAEDDALAFRDENGLPDGLRPMSVTFIPARIEDNPVGMAGDPGYATRLEALPRVERERLRGGNWLIRETAGTVLDRAWFRIVDALPVGARAVRYWDKAGTEGGRGAETAGVKITRDSKHGLWYIADVVHGRWGDMQREAVIKQTAESDGYGVAIRLEQEPGSGGKDSAAASVRMLAGYDVRARPVTGDKVERARPFSAQAEAGNVLLKRAPWNETFLAQAHAFPEGVIDIIDATVGAFNELARGEAGGDVAVNVGGLERAPSWQIGGSEDTRSDDLEQEPAWRI